METVSIESLFDMWLLQDGAPSHFILAVRRYLNETFPDMWIGLDGPILWASRSPDINPVDFFWGLVRSLGYETPTNDMTIYIKEY